MLQRRIFNRSELTPHAGIASADAWHGDTAQPVSVGTGGDVIVLVSVVVVLVIGGLVIVGIVEVIVGTETVGEAVDVVNVVGRSEVAVNRQAHTALAEFCA